MGFGLPDDAPFSGRKKIGLIRFTTPARHHTLIVRETHDQSTQESLSIGKDTYSLVMEAPQLGHF
jgi:hypothetical protein